MEPLLYRQIADLLAAPQNILKNNKLCDSGRSPCTKGVPWGTPPARPPAASRHACAGRRCVRRGRSPRLRPADAAGWPWDGRNDLPKENWIEGSPRQQRLAECALPAQVARAQATPLYCRRIQRFRSCPAFRRQSHRTPSLRARRSPRARARRHAPDSHHPLPRRGTDPVPHASAREPSLVFIRPSGSCRSRPRDDIDAATPSPPGRASMHGPSASARRRARENQCHQLPQSNVLRHWSQRMRVP